MNANSNEYEWNVVDVSNLINKHNFIVTIHFTVLYMFYLKADLNRQYINILRRTRTDVLPVTFVYIYSNRFYK